MARKDLLSEAIADAKAVKETAMANAKLALEEAFTPKLQSMISAKLAEEAEDEEDMDETYEGEETEKAEEAYHSEEEMEMEEEEEMEMEEEEEMEMDSEEEMEMEEEDEMEMDSEEEMEMDLDSDDSEEEEMEMDSEEDEDELDLESIIRELEDENEMEDSEEEETEEAYHEEEDMGDEEDMDEEEEIDLDEVIRTLKEMEDSEEEVSEEEDMGEEEDTTEELEEAYRTIESLRGTINEVNLLNAKLLYTNKLFRTFDLNEGQKVKVLENFDRTSSVREVKLVFSTLAENLNVAKKTKVVVKEGYASKATKSSAPKKIISEGNDMAARWKKLAGLI